MRNGPKTIILKNAEGLTAGIAHKARTRRETARVQLEHAIRCPAPRNDLSPALSLEYRSIPKLEKAARRLRRSSAGQFEDLKDSIGQFGLCGTVVISSEGEIIDGHTVVEACKAMGIMEVPCLVIGHLSKGDIRRLRISLNRIQEKGNWDFDALSAEIQDLAVEFGSDFHIPGIELPELDALLLDNDPDPNDELEGLCRETAEIVSCVGDVWQLGPHVIACGEA